jgi:hypothetical protein
MPFYNPQFVMGFSCCSGFYFCVVFCESLFVFFSRLAIVLPYLNSVGHCPALPHLGWPLYCLTSSRLAIVLPYLLSVGHCTALPCLPYDFWLCLWYLQTFLSGKDCVNTWTTCLDFWSCRCSSMAFFNSSFCVLTCSDGVVLCVAFRLPKYT